jgi:hypothetical protein
MSRRVMIKKSGDVRFYLYVSDTKVNMLFEQIFSTSKRTFHVDLKVKAGFVDGTAGISNEEYPPDRDDKLRAVEDFLVEQNLVGTPQDPKDYFKGVLPMRWGMYDDLESRPEDCPSLVYFGGFDPTAPLIVGLGGSSMHVLGHSGATSTYSRSATPTLVRWIVKGLYSDKDIDTLRSEFKSGINGDLFEGICVALHYLKPPTQQLEFLAKTLCIGKSYGLKHMTGVDETNVVLGTPLYVQQTHRLPDEGDNRFGLDDEWKEHLKNTNGSASE